ncbi:MAG: T9SS type B sorting domain-containing protein, partial [Paludibacteraceae bacterium]|nr:T9SS type B sorting domain-containing protein [Paludibacteraceae bacterium]
KQRLCIDLVIPPYFTPNGDGISDVWKVYGLEKTENSKVEIFDRWGKLLFEFNPNSSGWDGTYNGELCPSSDYWYVIDCEEIDKEYTGHFTLLR